MARNSHSTSLPPARCSAVLLVLLAAMPSGAAMPATPASTSGGFAPRTGTTAAAVEWLDATLAHAADHGEASATLPLPLPLNANATWLGLWTGTAKVHVEWSFKPVPAAQS